MGIYIVTNCRDSFRFNTIGALGLLTYIMRMFLRHFESNIWACVESQPYPCLVFSVAMDVRPGGGGGGGVKVMDA